jgi:hypothetical protein
MKKTLVLGAVLSLSSLCFAGAKSYHVFISNPSTVAGVKLRPGSYKVKVDGDTAIFSDDDSNKFKTTVKVTTVDKKYEATAVDATKGDGVDAVNAIEIGGSTTKLEFTK